MPDKDLLEYYIHSPNHAAILCTCAVYTVGKYSRAVGTAVYVKVTMELIQQLI